MTLEDVDYFVFYDKPFLNSSACSKPIWLTRRAAFRSFAKAMPVWSREKLFQRDILRDALSRAHADLDIDEN